VQLALIGKSFKGVRCMNVQPGFLEELVVRIRSG
jgi:hypothetical protein